MASKTNFASHETSQRLFAAFIASLPAGFKFDYKIIAKYLGQTESAIEHRFRPLKLQGEFLQRALHQSENGGPPMAEHLTQLPTIKNRESIQKYFGASTEQGLEFQARTWKKNAKVLVNAVETGQDPAAAFKAHLAGGGKSSDIGAASSSSAGAGVATPKRARAAPAAKTPGTAKRRKTTAAAATATDAIIIKDEEPSLTDDVDSTDVNYDEMDLTDDSPRVIKTEKAAANRTPVAPGSGMSMYKAKELATYRAQDAAVASGRSPTKAIGNSFGVSPATTPTMANNAAITDNIWGLNGFGTVDEDDGGFVETTPSKAGKSSSAAASQTKTKGPDTAVEQDWYNHEEESGYDEYDV
ncbi:hypothetical protein QBC43DRAFT_85432 [Cladorrhinum sp. PSN259]|nr:hypothetical protein QBC43DRAFT_85432 [Cladorrhinum sp. PSN259]